MFYLLGCRSSNEKKSLLLDCYESNCCYRLYWWNILKHSCSGLIKMESTCTYLDGDTIRLRYLNQNLRETFRRMRKLE